MVSAAVALLIAARACYWLARAYREIKKANRKG